MNLNEKMSIIKHAESLRSPEENKENYDIFFGRVKDVLYDYVCEFDRKLTYSPMCARIGDVNIKSIEVGLHLVNSIDTVYEVDKKIRELRQFAVLEKAFHKGNSITFHIDQLIDKRSTPLIAYCRGGIDCYEMEFQKDDYWRLAEFDKDINFDKVKEVREEALSYINFAAESLKENHYFFVDDNKVIRQMMDKGFDANVVAVVVRQMSEDCAEISVNMINEIVQGKDCINNSILPECKDVHEKCFENYYIDCFKECEKQFLKLTYGTNKEVLENAVNIVDRIGYAADPILTIKANYQTLAGDAFFQNLNDGNRRLEHVNFMEFMKAKEPVIVSELLKMVPDKSDKIIDVLEKYSPVLALEPEKAKIRAKAMVEKAFKRMEKEEQSKDNINEKPKTQAKAKSNKKGKDGIEI